MVISNDSYTAVLYLMITKLNSEYEFR